MRGGTTTFDEVAEGVRYTRAAPTPPLDHRAGRFYRRAAATVGPELPQEAR